MTDSGPYLRTLFDQRERLLEEYESACQRAAKRSDRLHALELGHDVVRTDEELARRFNAEADRMRAVLRGRP